MRYQLSCGQTHSFQLSSLLTLSPRQSARDRDGRHPTRKPSPLPHWAWSWKVQTERNLNGKGTGRCEVSKVANTYWVDERIRAHRVTPRTSSLASVQQISAEILGTRTEVRRRGGIIPSWVVFGMILLATFAVCVTVNMRTRARVQVAAQQLTSMRTDVEALRNVNQSLKAEVEKLRTDPRTIELAARARLNMVRSNEFVVPVE